MEDFERIRKAINERQASPDLVQGEVKDLSPQEKLKRWKSVTTEQFNYLNAK